MCSAGRRPRRGAKSAQELCLPLRLSQAHHSCRGDGKNNRTSPGHDCESAGSKAKSPITVGDYRPGPVAFASAIRRTSSSSIASNETPLLSRLQRAEPRLIATANRLYHAIGLKEPVSRRSEDLP